MKNIPNTAIAVPDYTPQEIIDQITGKSQPLSAEKLNERVSFLRRFKISKPSRKERKGIKAANTENRTALTEQVINMKAKERQALAV